VLRAAVFAPAQQARMERLAAKLDAVAARSTEDFARERKAEADALEAAKARKKRGASVMTIDTEEGDEQGAAQGMCWLRVCADCVCASCVCAGVRVRRGGLQALVQLILRNTLK